MQDPREAAAQYRLERLRESSSRSVPERAPFVSSLRSSLGDRDEGDGEDPDAAGRRVSQDAADAASVDPPGDAAAREAQLRADATARTPTAADRAAFVETVIQQAIRRGDFENLPGAGKPLSLGETHDPDWWIRRKIQAEQLRGLGPPALTLRVEHAELADRLDELNREPDVREHLEDFNRRVIEARRQLLGGPPVVTPTRDVEADVAAWHERRAARRHADAAARTAVNDEGNGSRRRRRSRRSP